MRLLGYHAIMEKRLQRVKPVRRIERIIFPEMCMRFIENFATVKSSRGNRTLYLGLTRTRVLSNPDDNRI